jgi:putative transposase
LSQAIMKRGRPTALMSDNGSAMIAAETVQGLERLSITHCTTLPRTPESNGKQESFWNVIEGRLMPQLEGEPTLTLELLNRATQAFVEHDYHRNKHSELDEPPLTRYMRDPSVRRPSPSSDELRRAFRMTVVRKQRLTDGTITVEGIRYEMPSAYRSVLRPTVRVARWDLSVIDLVDPRNGKHLMTLQPIDKEGNSDGHRRPLPARVARTVIDVGIAPLLRQQMADYAATGAPPAYIAKDDIESNNNDDTERT